MLIERLSWDSNFFGFEVGKAIIEPNTALNAHELNLFDLTYIFVGSNDLASNNRLKDSGALLVDEKITYLKKVMSVADRLKNVYSYRTESEEGDQQVIRVGLQSGFFSRFNNDPKIPREKFVELYTLWIRRSIDRSLAKELFVYRRKNQIEGLVTIGEKDKRADIGLIAVDQNMRGAGIGGELLRRAEAYCYANNYLELQVITQKKNVNACRFYERSGFFIESTVNVYHLWKK